MSLGIVVKGPEGLVLAAESRVTITAQLQNGQQLHVNFDHATKLLSFSDPNTAVGVVTYGQAAINLRTAASYLPEFESGLPDKRLSVEEFAQHLSDFYARQWAAEIQSPYTGPDMTFVVAGFNENEAYGRAYQVGIPSFPAPVEQVPDDFGITWGGQREFVDRLIQGFDANIVELARQSLNLQPEQIQQFVQALAPLQMPIPLRAMALQDCVDLAIYFIRTTMGAQKLTVGIRGVGGPIDVATITRQDGLRFVQRKQISGEPGTPNL